MPSAITPHLRSRIGKVCVAITGASPAEMIERASAAVKETTFLEFRLDYLDKPLAGLPLFKQFLAENTAATAIATCRRTPNGGRFGGTVPAQLDILLKAAEAGFQIVDVELESAEALNKPDLEKLRSAGAAIILSYHHFSETPDLDAIYRRIETFAPDFVKVVPTARKLTDNVTMMRFLERISDSTSVIGLCMGDAGIVSRVLGLRSGSLFTFAATTVGEETGPGQIAARTLVETYRIEEVDAATKIYGVAGDPIRQSLSPMMMNTAFRRETVNAVYLALCSNDVADLVKLIHQVPLQGVSITMPLKQAILPFLEHTDPLSAKIGACNTILRAPGPAGDSGKLYGFNTDVQGIVLPLEKRLPLKGAKILVLGAGGTARAAVFGLRDKGAEVFILNRTPEPAAKLAKQAGAKVFKREALAKASFDVIINATSVGMAGHTPGSPLNADELKTRLVFDLVYNPVDTPLLKLARAQGIPVITGVEMFVQQGARQFEIWTGKPAPEEEMLKVVLHALRQQTDPSGSAAATPLPTPAPLAPADAAAPPAPSGAPSAASKAAPQPDHAAAPAQAAKSGKSRKK